MTEKQLTKLDQKMDRAMVDLGALERRVKKIFVIVQSIAEHLQEIEERSVLPSSATTQGGYMITAKVLPTEGVEVETPDGPKRFQQGQWLSAETGEICDEPTLWSYS
jgi:hypothetical protein